MVTWTFGTTAPVGSVTVPVMTPCTVCDQATPLIANSRTTANRTTTVRTRTLHPLPLNRFRDARRIALRVLSSGKIELPPQVAHPQDWRTEPLRRIGLLRKTLVKRKFTELLNKL